MSIKLIAIDIDGTLLNSKNEITPRVFETIQKAEEKGIKVVLCTGRPLLGVAEQLHELKLDQSENFVITYNGSLVQEVTSKKIIASYTLSYENFVEIESTARLLGSHLHTLDLQNIYTANMHISPYTVHEATLTKMPLHYRPVDQMTPDMTIVKMMMIDPEEKLDQTIEKVPDWFKEKYTTVKSAPFYFEVLNKQASKGNAVRLLADYLGINQEEVMAIGDQENDATMIEYAGMGVAMGNATPAIKALANVETLSNDEDGVAHIIEKFAL